MALFSRNLRFIQVDDLYPFCLVRTNCSEIPQVLISSVELHLSATFPLFLNLFVTFPLGSPLIIGEDHTEMGFGRKEFWNPAQWTKYSHLELIFPNFLNKILVFLPVEPVLLWHRKNFWPKDVFIPKLWSVDVRWFYYSYDAASAFVALF